MITKAELKRFASLNLKKNREELGLFLVEGQRAVDEASGSGAVLHTVVHTRGFAETGQGKRLLETLRERHVRIEVVQERELASVSDTVHAQGVVALVRLTATDPASVLPATVLTRMVVALDAVADPGNLGSIIRTCDWFGADGVLLGKNCVDLQNPKVVRATMGSLFHLPIAKDADLDAACRTAKEHGYSVAVADSAGETVLAAARISRKLMVIFGNEARGVSDALKASADLRLAIPRYGAAESLNVGVACGVILAALRKER